MTPELQHLNFNEPPDCLPACAAGASPTLVFLPGYASDMEGAKALALDAFAERRGLAMLRFDYSGTGSSGGAFEDGTLGAVARGKPRGDRPADQGPADPGRLVDGRLDRAARRAAPARAGPGAGRHRRRAGLHRLGLQPTGRRRRAAGISRGFWESGQQLRLLDGEIAIDCPVRLIHGELDRDVPLDVAFRTMRALRSADVQLNGDQGRRPPAVGAARDRDDPAHRRRTCWSLPHDLLPLPPPLPPPRLRQPAVRTWSPRTRSSAARSRRRRAADPRKPRRRSRKPRRRRPTRIRKTARMWAAAGNLWIAANQPGKAALDLDRALACRASKPSSAARPCSTAPAPPKRRTTSGPPAPRRPRPRQTISDDPFYWYFSAALAIRENDPATAQDGDRQGADARAVRPDDPVRSRPCRATSPAMTTQARSYWMRAAGSDPNGPIGKAAAKAIEMLGVTPTVKTRPSRSRSALKTQPRS